MRVGVVLAIGLTLVAMAVGVVLSSSPLDVVGTSSVAVGTEFASIQGRAIVCQGDEVLPRDTSAVRLSLEASIGPRVTVTVLSGRRILTRGTLGSAWTGANVTVPVERVRRTTSHVRVCITVGRGRGAITVLGAPSSRSLAATVAGQSLLGRMRVEYLAAGRRSWWSLALPVARRIGLGRAPSGTWIVLLLALLMASVATLASCLCVRELRAGGCAVDRATPGPARRLGRVARMVGRVPAAAWICALVACLNAVCWSILSPPFQAPDETAHFAYVQQLAEARQLPRQTRGAYSSEEETALEDLHQSDIRFVPGAKTISSRADERKLERDLARPLARRGSGYAGVASSEPPLYYALAVIPYDLASSGSLLDRLQLMRLLSALFGGLTALFAFLFVREALPGAPWAWTVGGLGVALAPLLGFVSGSVNPDAMLFAVSAALFYLLARAFRRGLTIAIAIAIGTTTAVGLLTKLNFLGLAPGVVVGLVVVALQAPPESRRCARRALAIALAIVASPALLYIALTSLTNRESLGLGLVSSSLASVGSVLNENSYAWQFFLPRLPGMTSYFPGVFTPRQLWFNGLVGLYGWSDTVFPGWVDELALAPAGIVALLCLRALLAGRAALRSRAVELMVYAAMGIGVVTLVGISSYVSDILGNNGPFWEPRYLLPMLPLLGAGLTLAARGAGRRWGPASGALIVVLILAHDVFSQLLVISGYYG